MEAACILVVDDEPANVLLFRAQLKTENYRVLSAHTGPDALALLNEELPDLILLDVMMPGMSGYEVARHIKDDPRTHHIPIIMVTALTDQHSRMEALENGAEEFLTKPVNRPELLVRVRNLLKLKQYHNLLLRHTNLLQEQVDEQSSQLATATTRLTQAEQRLIEAEKLASIGRLAAGIAHEINNPLGFIKSNLNALGDYATDFLEALVDIRQRLHTLPDSPERQALEGLLLRLKLHLAEEDIPDLLNESRTGIHQVCTIINNLKNFARIESASEWQTIAPEECIENTLNVLCGEWPASLGLQRDYHATTAILCQPSDIQQVLYNVILNAITATQQASAPCLTLRTGEEDHCVWIEIEDTGCGIPAEVLPRVFDPFFTTKQVGSGTGLGLSLSYGIMQRHQGTLDIRSQPGIGTTVRLTFPPASTFAETL